MATKVIHTFNDGDFPVTLARSNKANRFDVVYGADVSKGLTYAEAAKAYGECVFHSLACAGKLEAVV